MKREELLPIVERELYMLTPRERAVVSRRFGLDGLAKKTVREIAQEYAVPVERIRQIERKALKRINDAVRARNDTP